jgi:hypothetical protein
MFLLIEERCKAPTTMISEFLEFQAAGNLSETDRVRKSVILVSTGKAVE